MLQTIFVAIAFLLIFEGLAYALAPRLIERLLEMLKDSPPQAVQNTGLAVAALGVVFLFLASLFG